jgi:hypothetical protein
MNLYIVREDISNFKLTMSIIRTYHTVFCVPSNSSLYFIKHLIRYPLNTAYKKIIFLIPKGSVISEKFKDIEIHTLHKNIIIKYIN